MFLKGEIEVSQIQVCTVPNLCTSKNKSICLDVRCFFLDLRGKWEEVLCLIFKCFMLKSICLTNHQQPSEYSKVNLFAALQVFFCRFGPFLETEMTFSKLSVLLPEQSICSLVTCSLAGFSLLSFRKGASFFKLYFILRCIFFAANINTKIHQMLWLPEAFLSVPAGLQPNKQVSMWTFDQGEVEAKYSTAKLFKARYI